MELNVVTLFVVDIHAHPSAPLLAGPLCMVCLENGEVVKIHLDPVGSLHQALCKENIHFFQRQRKGGLKGRFLSLVLTPPRFPLFLSQKTLAGH